MLDGARVRAIREERALTLRELAARVADASGDSVAESTVSTWETGRRQPTPKHFQALCSALGVSREALLRDP